jgi:hypothetical protein
MSNRSVHMPYYCILIGLLSMSIGYNILFWHRIEVLTLKQDTTWVTPEQMELIKQEIDRLERQSVNSPKN